MRKALTQKSFEFTTVNKRQIERILLCYPEGREQSGLLPILHLAQKQNNGWISSEVIKTVAETLNIAPVHVLEVVSFHHMFQVKPRGRYLIQLCRTTPCWLCGSSELRQVCRKFLGIEDGETSKDGLFSLQEVECLGACTSAPVMQMNEVYYEGLDPEAFEEILNDLKLGKNNAS
jgi:NADH-quinone oxidoreductase E subunit